MRYDLTKQRVRSFICYTDDETGKNCVGGTPELIGVLNCDFSIACTCGAIKTGRIPKDAQVRQAVYS